MREPLALVIPDLSEFARALSRGLAETERPGHLALLNLIARAAGFRNHQHLRAQGPARRSITTPHPEPDWRRLRDALRHFDKEGGLIRWPAKTSIQHLAVTALWSRLPKDCSMTEREISARLDAHHAFGDAAILRRTMIELKLLSRTPDGRDYRRLERDIGADGAELIRLLKPRLA